MRRALPALWLLTACGSEGGLAPLIREESGAPDTASGEAITPVAGAARLQGRVLNLDGDPIPGATITVGAAQTLTNAKGFFYLKNLSEGKAVVQVEAEGYSTNGAVRHLERSAWAYVDFTLAPATVLRWDPAEGGALQTEDGVEIDLGRILDAFGDEVRDPLNVSVTLLNTAESVAAAPGALMAMRAGQDVPIETLGMIEVHLRDDAGLPLQLGEPATISFPLADTPSAHQAPSFRLYGYDETQARWTEEEGGAASGSRFEAEVEHFSWWNCDNYLNTDQCVTGTLVIDGAPVANASLSLYETQSLTQGDFPTDENGRFTVGVPVASEVQLRLRYSGATWESDLLSMPDTVVAEEDRPEGCLDLGEIVARTSDNDKDGYASDTRGGPDCDDDDATLHPGAIDVPYDGVDTDCGGEDDYDQDGDGYVPSGSAGLPTTDVTGSGALPDGDCADSDFWTNPGRVETCDGTDNNCSGDELDASDIGTWYRDRDHDGFGTDASAMSTCNPPAYGWVVRGGDCDDAEGAQARYYPGAPEVCGDNQDYNCDGSVDTEDADGDGALACEDCDDADATSYPGAEEVCDGLDNNCDGSLADEPLITYALDYDADSYGDASATHTGCAVPDGFVVIAGGEADCDDLDAERYPGAPELCEDGVVQDCDGDAAAAVAACAWSGDLSLAEADAKLEGESELLRAGQAVAGAGDTNGDGLADLLVGTRGGTSSPGVTYLVLGPVSGERSLADADTRLTGEVNGDYAGAVLAGAGDLDGDGFDDLVIGAKSHDPDAAPSEAGGLAEGAAYLMFGPVSGDVALVSADLKLVGTAVRDQLGEALAGAGDVDGDGLDDLFFGTKENTTAADGAGAAWLILGPVAGRSAIADPDALLTGEAEDDAAGGAVAIAGDMDGDGLDDLLVGAEGSDAGATDAGAAYVVLGPVSGVHALSDADARLAGDTAEANNASVVRGAGDCNGDGYADALIGSPDASLAGVRSGLAYLILGPVSGDHSLSDADATLKGEGSYDDAGHALEGVGDTDADGYDDFLVGAYGNDDAARGAGAAYLVRGPVSGAYALASADVRFFGEVASDDAGAAVAGAGDTDGDGRPDVLISGSGNDSDAGGFGAAYLLLSPSY